VSGGGERPQVRPLSKGAVPMALQKADRYRLLNEPGEAESICRDVLAADPGNVAGAETLLLALADQFGRGLAGRFEEAMALAGRLADAFDREYFTGLVCERRAKVHLRQDTPGCGPLARDWFDRAMRHFLAAHTLRPEGGDEALLRYNACVRNLDRHRRLLDRPDPPDAPVLSD
jgi:hypothetical protein